MSRYTGPSWKQSRRLGFSLTGTGKELARRNYVPGQHGPNNRSKLSEYGLQLAEKQKLRFSYGLGEKQFRNLFVQATKVKGGTLGFNFMVLLERRLDNVVYRLGLATTRRQARQFVNHGHILVDGKRVDIPSYRVEVGQVISVREKSAKVPAILEAVEATIGLSNSLGVSTSMALVSPPWPMSFRTLCLPWGVCALRCSLAIFRPTAATT